MKRFLLPILIIGCMILIAGACSNEEGEELGPSASLKKPTTVSEHSLIKEPTRAHPGWVCPLHPHQKSIFPQHNCPLCNSQLVRKGEWTCPKDPQVSAATPGNCPLCGGEFIKVEELEKREGKTIDELMKLALAKEKSTAK